MTFVEQIWQVGVSTEGDPRGQQKKDKCRLDVELISSVDHLGGAPVREWLQAGVVVC